MRKSAFCTRGTKEADQGLCFRYVDSRCRLVLSHCDSFMHEHLSVIGYSFDRLIF